MDRATNVSAPAPAQHTKQYVFVDEYNRHKRLKVMRACDGCRKRKIRCDGALQNGPWPCGACVRLKLKCIPPTLDQDDDLVTPDTASSQQTFSFENTTFPTSTPVSAKPGNHHVAAQPHLVHDWSAAAPQPQKPTAALPTTAPELQHAYNTAAYQQPYQQQHLPQSGYSPEQYFNAPSGQPQYQPTGQPPTFIRSQSELSGSSDCDPQEVDASVRELSEQMGDLKIGIDSAAPYMMAQNAATAQAVEEAEVVLPSSVYADSTPRIPPEMMPTEEAAMGYFKYFFDYVHPYCPVLNRAEFYHQWQTARGSISPLTLEAIFACVARYVEEPIEHRKWLALAARHEESYKDVPHLSTIQAMMILMKARESISKKGYYYRSWMTIKYMINMAIDLGLHQHIDKHQPDNICTLKKSDCLLWTRIWESLFILEMWVGPVQGRTDFTVEADTVQATPPPLGADIDPYELQTSRRSAFLAQTVKIIKVSNHLWQSIRRYKKDWALDPVFVRHNEDMPKWLKSLPADFQIHFPEDESPPWLNGDHFVASLHAYFHLVIVMHHRPQMQALLERRDPGFKPLLDICLSSATQMCRIQEALYRDFGFHGLHFMVRGVNFNVYCVLTCTMLHLAAITYPDPVANTKARMYFTRHMRVLEHCLPGSPPEMQAQINALREAFSADTSLPFELKPTLGLRSPTMENHPTPPSSTGSGPTSAPVTNASWSTMDAVSSKTMNPATDYGHSYESLTGQGVPGRPAMPHHNSSYEIPPHTSYSPQHIQQVTSAPQIGYSLEPVISNEVQTPVWDPSGIFNQWNTAFGGGAPPPQQPSPTDPRSIQPTSAPMVSNHSPLSASAISAAYGGTQQMPISANAVVPDPAPPAMPTVTPVMWQDAFTNAYVSGHGQKRYREASVDQSAYTPQYPSSKRRG